MRIRERSRPGALAALIVAAVCLVFDAGCASAKRGGGASGRSLDFAGTPRRTLPYPETSRPRGVTPQPPGYRDDAAAGARSAALPLTKTPADDSAPSPVATTGGPASAVVSMSQESTSAPSSTIVTTTQSTPAAEQRSRALPFLIGFAIVAAAGVLMLVWRARSRAGG
jgi:hypothetical protein